MALAGWSHLHPSLSVILLQAGWVYSLFGTPKLLLHSVGQSKSQSQPGSRSRGMYSTSWWEELQSHIARVVGTEGMEDCGPLCNQPQLS